VFGDDFAPSKSYKLSDQKKKSEISGHPIIHSYESLVLIFKHFMKNRPCEKLLWQKIALLMSKYRTKVTKVRLLSFP